MNTLVGIRLPVLVCAAIAMAACKTPSAFVSTWKADDAMPLELSGTRVAAVVMIRDESARRTAEDALTSEIKARGAFGIPMYTIFSGTPANEPGTREALEVAGIKAVIVMRPTNIDAQLANQGGAPAAEPQGGFWSYYAHGWASPWNPPGADSSLEVQRPDVTVSVETLVYSMRQQKVVWRGQSRTTNPENAQQLIRDLAQAATEELQKEGLLARS